MNVGHEVRIVFYRSVDNRINTMTCDIQLIALSLRSLKKLLTHIQQKLSLLFFWHNSIRDFTFSTVSNGADPSQITGRSIIFAYTLWAFLVIMNKILLIVILIPLLPESPYLLEQKWTSPSNCVLSLKFAWWQVDTTYDVKSPR